MDVDSFINEYEHIKLQYSYGTTITFIIKVLMLRHFYVPYNNCQECGGVSKTKTENESCHWYDLK